MGIIRLKNMLFYGYHGVSDSEKELGGKFEVDLELKKSLKQAGLSDKLEDTLDYEAVYQTIYTCIQGKKFYLLEALAEHIAKTILTQFEVEQIGIRVRKPNAPIRGVLDSVEVEIKRRPSDYV